MDTGMEEFGICWSGSCRNVSQRCSGNYCPTCCWEKHRPGRCTRAANVNTTGEFGAVTEIQLAKVKA